MSYTKGPWYVDVNETTTNIESKYQTIAFDVSNCDAEVIASLPDLFDLCKKLIDNSSIGMSPTRKTIVRCKLEDIQQLENLINKFKASS